MGRALVSPSFAVGGGPGRGGGAWLYDRGRVHFTCQQMSSRAGTREAGLDLSPDPGRRVRVCAHRNWGGAGRTREVPQAVATWCDSEHTPSCLSVPSHWPRLKGMPLLPSYAVSGHQG